jgi:hypothetical protein
MQVGLRTLQPALAHDTAGKSPKMSETVAT